MITTIVTIIIITSRGQRCLKGLNVAVGLQRGEEDIHQPQAEEQTSGQHLGDLRSTELPSNLRPAPVDEDSNADEGKDGEECDGEGQCPRVHLELLSLGVVVDGSDGPGHADAQEHVHGVAPCHVPDGSVRVLVLNGRYLTGKGV